MISEEKPIESCNDEIVYPSLGGIVGLDRTMPPQSVTHYDEYCFETHSVNTIWRDFIPTEHVIRHECLTYPELNKDCYAYALTFTFNATYMKDKSPLEQWELFETKFVQWKALFTKRMIALQNDRHFIAYEIYPELTKNNIVHAHGLFYYSSGYENTRTIMSKAWVDKTKKDCGTSLTAMKKKTPKGYDYAFDRCNNVASWRKYITKEHPEYANKPCLILVEPTTSNINLSYEEHLRSLLDRTN